MAYQGSKSKADSPTKNLTPAPTRPFDARIDEYFASLSLLAGVAGAVRGGGSVFAC
jgi:hypothetical protein